MIECKRCGSMNSDTAKFCKHCRSLLKTDSKNNNAKSNQSNPVDFQKSVEEAKKSIVQIKTAFLDPETKRPGIGAGTGFVVEGGFVVTNCHNLEGLRISETTATFDPSVDSVTYNLKLICAVPEADIAVLRFQGLMDRVMSKRPHLKIRTNPPLAMGESVYTIGNPLNLGISVNTGLVSHPARQFNHRGLSELVQITISLNHGNSGGPLLDMDNNVVGITTAGFSKPGADMCVPAAEIVKILDRIKEVGE